MSGRVLLVDDDRNIRRMLRALLEDEGYEVAEASGGDAALGMLEELDAEVVLLDLVMPGGPDGLATLERIRAMRPDTEVVMMSGKATLDDAVRATKLGAVQFLEKPLSPEGVLVTIGTATSLHRTRAENRALRAALGSDETLVGGSRAIENLRTLITRIAATESRVLITGESGVGKELVARALHVHSPRAGGAFVSVNCAAIPRDLVESELFGHERGAFTGATARRRGKFELADGGTLFLDEVGDLGAEAQAKLLRALESGAIERVGGERLIAVDVRVIAATNRDLDRASAEARFRQDLLYRLKVLLIPVPPLRDRPDDIPLLVDHFARRVAARLGRRPVSFDQGALGQLRRYPWPGNVRELANAVERIAILAAHGTVGADDVARLLGAPGAVPADVGSANGLPLSEALDRVEAELIEGALAAACGNVAEAARRLQTDRANLYRRMRRLGIEFRDATV